MFAYFAGAIARVRGLAIFGVAMAAALAGCMMAPEFPRRVSVAEVVHNARCELYEAVQHNLATYPWVGDWSVGFDFSFVVDRDVNASADTTYLIPVHLGTFTTGLKGNLKQKAKGTYAVSYKILKGLRNYSYANCSPSLPGHGHGRLLSGEIGLRRWINDVVPQIYQARIPNPVRRENDSDDERTPDDKKVRDALGSLSGLTYTIEFGVTADGSLLPSWALTFPDKRQFRPGFGVFASEQNTHKLVVAMVPLPKPSADDNTAMVHTDKDGRQTIIGRRVCIIDGVNVGQCLDRDDRKLAEATSKVKELKKDLPRKLRSVPISEFENPKDKEVLNFTKENRKLVDELIDAKAQQDQAKAEVKASVRATEAARARARTEAENEASRRLDQLIQQQLLRDALRP